MDLNRVATFVRVVETGGITAAAKALGLRKSSVSRAVALLEEELGVRLLQRSSRKVALTEAGTAFYERASQGVAVVEEAGAAIADMDGALRGTIRITAPVDVGVWMLAPTIAAFARLHPDVHLDVVLTGRVVDLVEEGFDLAIRAGRLRDSSLVARKLSDTDFALYAAPRYLERHGEPASVSELSAHRCVLFRATRGRATWTLTGPSGDESVELSGLIGSDDLSFLWQTVLAGVGIGLLPEFLCEQEVKRGRLLRVMPAYHARGAPLSVVYPSARYVPQRVAVFRDFLVERLAQKFNAA